MTVVRRAGVTFLVALTAPMALQAQKQSKFENHVLATMALAGQQVAVLPLTLIVADSAVAADSSWAPYRARDRATVRADSMLGEVLQDRAPEINWVLPRRLRSIARRAPGMLPDPAHMGQAVMRSPRLEQLPDPFRSTLRTLIAFTDARMALIPAAVAFSHDSTGAVRADLSIVLADTRRGTVLWRSLGVATGTTPDAAFRAAVEKLLPSE